MFLFFFFLSFLNLCLSDQSCLHGEPLSSVSLTLSYPLTPHHHFSVVFYDLIKSFSCLFHPPLPTVCISASHNYRTYSLNLSFRSLVLISLIEFKFKYFKYSMHRVLIHGLFINYLISFPWLTDLHLPISYLISVSWLIDCLTLTYIICALHLEVSISKFFTCRFKP